MPLTGLGGDVGADRLSGPFDRRHCERSPDGDADSGSLQGAGEDPEGQGNLKEFPAPGVIGLIVR